MHPKKSPPADFVYTFEVFEPPQALKDWVASQDWNELGRIGKNITRLKESSDPRDRALAEVFGRYSIEEWQTLRESVFGGTRGRRPRKEFEDVEEAAAEYIRRTDAGEPAGKVELDIARGMKARRGTTPESKQRRLRSAVAKRRNRQRRG